MGKKKHNTAERERKQRENSNVAEATRIRISQILEKFRFSNTTTVYTFDEPLSSHERAVVHQVCRKMGMKSKSKGRGNQRHISVYKIERKQDSLKKKEALTCLTMSEESEIALQELFMNYPPEDGELDMKLYERHSGKGDGSQRKSDDMFSKPLWNQSDIRKKVESLNSRKQKSANLRQIVEERFKLPIASFRDAITSTVESNQVVLISGGTGCGKTTQVPQFLLEHMWGKGETCKIICTQPRRISATSVAERISFERGESIGDNIGYKIRLESKGGRHSSIVFCTNGLLLRVLVSKGSAKLNADAPKKSFKDEIYNITHIIVDEVHERDRYSDFMLAIFRDMLPLYPHLRLILMSATLDAERFSQYFGGCPIIRVPGFTYPVKSFYLEDVLSILKSAENNHLDFPNEGSELNDEDKVALDEAIHLAWLNDEFDPLLDLVSSERNPNVYNYQHSLTGLTPLMVFAGKGRVGDACMLLSFGANCNLRTKDGMTALAWAEKENQQETTELIRKHVESVQPDSMEQQQLLDKYLETINPDLIDVVLMERLLRKICIDSKEGAILVFLPGWDDINRTREKLVASPFFKDASKFLIIPLHSMVSSVEQKKVFKHPPQGCRKIILSTNIAESAITIDDVVYVIDSGRMKEKSYDPYNNVSTLHSSWISKASAKQREGRAGRCQPGICYHLYSKLRYASLQDFQVPEIKRVPIEELCLQIKLLDPNGKIENFLQKTLDPPVSETIQNAIVVLQDIGALSIDEDLTELGEKLGSLPVHPCTSKMLFFAILMNCLDPALTLACTSDYKDPFIIPALPNEKKKANEAKFELASLYGGHSDQLALVAAFECWKNANKRGQEARFCSQYFISPTSMHMLQGMRKQLESELIRSGFIPEDVSSCSLNARDPGILLAVLVAGLYPMVGRLLPPKNGKCCVVETINGRKVRLHPKSLNFKLSFDKSEDRCPLVAFDEITRGDGGMYIRNCTVVAPLPLLLLATEIAVAPANENEDNDDEEDDGSDESESDEDGTEKDDKIDGQHGEKLLSNPDNSVTVIVDRWLHLGLTALAVAQIYCLRERLSAAILFKVQNPRKALPPALAASMYATACILSFDGLSGMTLAGEGVDSSTSKANGTEIDKTAAGTRGTGNYPSGLLRSLMGHDMKPTSVPHYHKATGFLQPTGSVGMDPRQRTSFQGLNAFGSGSGTHPSSGRPGNSFKRQRGHFTASSQ